MLRKTFKTLSWVDRLWKYKSLFNLCNVQKTSEAMLTRTTRHHYHSFSVKCSSAHVEIPFLSNVCEVLKICFFAARYKFPRFYFNNSGITHQATPFDKCFAGRAYFRFSYFTFSIHGLSTFPLQGMWTCLLKRISMFCANIYLFRM